MSIRTRMWVNILSTTKLMKFSPETSAACFLFLFAWDRNQLNRPIAFANRICAQAHVESKVVKWEMVRAAPSFGITSGTKNHEKAFPPNYHRFVRKNTIRTSLPHSNWSSFKVFCTQKIVISKSKYSAHMRTQVPSKNVELCNVHFIDVFLALTKAQSHFVHVTIMHNNWFRFRCNDALVSLQLNVKQARAQSPSSSVGMCVCAMWNSVSAVRHWLQLWSQCTSRMQHAACIYNG